eukprot:1145203-Pelagomonas_calceolata.AAC.7
MAMPCVMRRVYCCGVEERTGLVRAMSLTLQRDLIPASAVLVCWESLCKFVLVKSNPSFKGQLKHSMGLA